MKKIGYILSAPVIVGMFSCGQINSHVHFNNDKGVQLYIKNFLPSVQQIDADVIADDVTIKGDAKGATYVIVRVSGDSISGNGIPIEKIQERADKYYDVQIIQKDSSELSVSVRQKINNVPSSEALSFSFEIHTSASAAATIKTVSGNIRLSRLTNADASSISGGIHAENISGQLTASTTSGNIEGENINSIGNMTSVNGEIKMNVNHLPNDIKISTTSSDIHLYYPKETAADIDFGTMSGDVKINNAGTANYSSKSGNKVVGTINGGGKSITANSISGNIIIN